MMPTASGCSVLDPDRDCPSCGFTLPYTAFPLVEGTTRRGTHRSKYCRECQGVRFLSQRVLAITAGHSVLLVGATALMRLGCSVAARFVLEYRPAARPTLPAARAAQRRAA